MTTNKSMTRPRNLLLLALTTLNLLAPGIAPAEEAGKYPDPLLTTPGTPEVFQKGLEADPKSVALLLRLGVLLVSEGKYAEAIAPLREALRLRPDEADAELQLGAALVETNQLDEAEKELLAAQKTMGDKNVGLELYLGKLYYMKQDLPKSIDAFNNYLKLAPENSPNSPQIRGLIKAMQDEIAKRSGH